MGELSVSDFQRVLARIENLQSAQKIEQVEDIVLQFVKDDIGMDGYSIHVFLPPEVRTLTSRPKEWMELYAERGYIEIDPIVTYGVEIGLQLKSGYRWSEALQEEKMSAAAYRVMRDSHDFDINFGISRFSYAFGRHTCLSMYTKSQQQEAYVAERFGDLLDYFTHSLHQAVIRLLDFCPEAAESLSQLTNKERSALQLLGKNGAVDIVADKMGISRRAVHGHLHSARQKFNVQTNAQLISSYYFQRRLVNEIG